MFGLLLPPSQENIHQMLVNLHRNKKQVPKNSFRICSRVWIGNIDWKLSNIWVGQKHWMNKSESVKNYDAGSSLFTTKKQKQKINTI